MVIYGTTHSCVCMREGWAWQKGHPLRNICPMYATMMKLGTVIPYLLRSKKYINHVPHPSISANISIFFTGNQQIYINKHRLITNYFNFLSVFKKCFNKVDYSFDASKKGYSRPSLNEVVLK